MSHYGWIRDLPDHRDYRFVPQIEAADLPLAVDLRPQCPPVRDQGQLGSCTAFAIGSAYEFEMLKQGLTDFEPAELFIYYNERRDMGTIASDSGASIRESAKTVATDGVCPAGDWPYVTQSFTQPPPLKAYQDAQANKVTQYLAVSQDDATMKACLAAGYPFVIGFTVYSSFEGAQNMSTGNMPMPDAGESVLGGHAVVVVGYDSTRDIYICRNSWGKSVMAAGYFYMPGAYLRNPQLASDFWTIRIVSGVQPTPTPVPPAPVPPTPPAPPAPKHATQVNVLYSDGSSKGWSL